MERRVLQEPSERLATAVRPGPAVRLALRAPPALTATPVRKAPMVKPERMG